MTAQHSMAQGPGAQRTAASLSGTTDFSGADAFWRIEEQLASDADPSTAEWDSLFATPGYAVLAIKERSRPAITAALRAAFMPSRRAERDSLLALSDDESRAASYVARVVRHVYLLPSRRTQLNAFRHLWEQDHYLARAITRAQRFLPTGTTGHYPQPRVAFVFYLPDGHADVDLIVADVAHAMVQGDPVRFIAHEVIHTYRNRLEGDRVASEGESSGNTDIAPLGDLLDRIENESIADQSDKAPFLDVSDTVLAREEPDSVTRTMLATYRAQFRTAPERIRGINRVLERVADSADDPEWVKARLDSLARTLPIGGSMAGRAVGAYMVRAIRRELGARALATVVGDPVSYVVRYEKAASRPSCRCPVFSTRALGVVLRLRRALTRSSTTP